MKQAPTSPLRGDVRALRQEIVDACLRMCRLGYFIGTWGNISVRVRQGMLITPTRVDYEAMRPEDIVLMSWEGSRLKGERLPSSEMHLHRLMLLARPDLGTLIHSHQPWCSSLACRHRSLPVIADDMAQIIGGKVSCSCYVPGGRHMELAAEACRAMGKESAAVLLANHGVVVGGRDLKEAAVAAEVLEKAAMMLTVAGPTAAVKRIPPARVREERHRYLFKYGTSADAETEGNA